MQALLAARLDSLEPFERRLVQQAAVVGRTFWEGALAPVAEDEGARPRTRRSPSLQREGHRRRRARRGGWPASRELAFKHVLIRDVAYGMLPKAVRGAQALRGRRLHRGARRRPHRRGRRAAGRALRARRRAGRRGAASPPTSSSPSSAKARALPRGRRRRRRAALLQPRGRRPLPVARAICSPRRARRRARASARSRATSRCGSAASTRRSRSGRSASTTTARSEDLERVADLHRKIGAGAVAQGRAQAGDRALPEGHQPAQGRPAVARARAPLRGGRVALHAHRRQHARHLRGREGAAPGRAARRDARRQPRARHLRPRVRAHRRRGEGAREPRARGRAGARLRPTPRRSSPCSALGHHLEVFEADYAAAERGLRGGARARRAPRRRCRRRSSCTPRSRSSPSTAPTGSSVERSTEASAELAEREGLVGKLCLPYALRGLLRWRDGDWDAAERLFRRAHELAEQVGWSEVAFSALFGLALVAARQRRPAPARRRRSTRRSTCASAPG